MFKYVDVSRNLAANTMKEIREKAIAFDCYPRCEICGDQRGADECDRMPVGVYEEGGRFRQLCSAHAWDCYPEARYLEDHIPNSPAAEEEANPGDDTRAAFDTFPPSESAPISRVAPAPAYVHHAEPDVDTVRALAEKVRVHEEEFRANMGRLAEQSRVRAILAEYEPSGERKRDGRSVTPLAKEDAMSKAARHSKNGKRVTAFRITTGHFVGKFVTFSEDAYEIRKHPTSHRIYHQLLARDWPGAWGEKEMLQHFTAIRTYTNGRMSWPASSSNFDISREVSTYSSLHTARLVATCMSMVHKNSTIELAVSRKNGNDTPYVVFFRAKPRNMDLVAAYENGSERLLREARQMRTLTDRCVLTTWGVEWVDASDDPQSSYVQAASASEAWNIVAAESGVSPSIFEEAAGVEKNEYGIRKLEIKQMDSGSKKDDEEDIPAEDLLGVMERWANAAQTHCDPGYATYGEDSVKANVG